MFTGTRRDFVRKAVSLAGAGALGGGVPPLVKAATSKGPHDFVIVEGHRDMWELSGRTRLKEADQHTPIANYLAQRLIDGGVTVCISPAGGGDSLDERDGTDEMLDGNMRVLDLHLTDIEQSEGNVTIIRTRADIPSGPTPGKVAFFLRRAPTFDHVHKWQAFGQPPESASLKFPQTFADLHPVWQWLTQNPPRLIAATRHRAHVGKLFLGIFRSVSATQSFHHSNQLSTKFQSPGDQ